MTPTLRRTPLSVLLLLLAAGIASACECCPAGTSCHSAPCRTSGSPCGPCWLGELLGAVAGEVCCACCGPCAPCCPEYCPGCCPAYPSACTTTSPFFMVRFIDGGTCAPVARTPCCDSSSPCSQACCPAKTKKHKTSTAAPSVVVIPLAQMPVPMMPPPMFAEPIPFAPAPPPCMPQPAVLPEVCAAEPLPMPRPVAPPIVRCVATEPARCCTTWQIRPLCEDGQDRLEIQCGDGTRATCESLVLCAAGQKGNGTTSCKLAVMDKHVTVEAPGLEAQADSVTRLPEDHLLLQGHVNLRYCRDGQGTRVKEADRVVIGLADGSVEVRPMPAPTRPVSSPSALGTSY
jgi:hypothetical protein